MHWLTALAKYMSTHSQVIFLLEQIQPSWLNVKAKIFYYSLSFLLIGLIVGISTRSVFGWAMGSFMGTFIGGLFATSNIEPIETLTLSWKKAGKGLLGG